MSKIERWVTASSWPVRSSGSSGSSMTAARKCWLLRSRASSPRRRVELGHDVA